MRVLGQAIVLEGTPDRTPPQTLVVAELDSEDEASAIFEVINQRISPNARRFDTRKAITSSSTPTGARSKRSPLPRSVEGLLGRNHQVEEINTSSIGLEGLAFGDFNGDGKTDVFRHRRCL
jgi:hypothetical protein